MVANPLDMSLDSNLRTDLPPNVDQVTAMMMALDRMMATFVTTATAHLFTSKTDSEYSSQTHICGPESQQRAEFGGRTKDPH